MRTCFIIRYVVLGILLILISSRVFALDYPHTNVNSIGCDSCHYIYGGEPSLLPPWTVHIPQDRDDTQYNTLCWSCHNDIEAPYMRTHSSLQIDEEYGQWTIECRTCHNPHSQDQLKSYTTASFLYSGASTDITTTTLTETGAGWTEDEYEGRVLVPNVDRPTRYKYSYKITGNTSDTITVEGPIDLNRVSVGDTFAVIYGKLIKSTITLDDIIDPSVPKTGDKTVRFFSSSGTNSFADGNTTYDGVCEVCHTETNYHQNDGGGSSHNAGLDCRQCHNHVFGFAHGGGGDVSNCEECHGHDPGYGGFTGGKGSYVSHSTHTEDDSDDLRGPHIGCAACHDTTNMPYFNSGDDADEDGRIVLSETDVCDTCHSAGGSYDGIDDSIVGAKNNWSDAGSSTSPIYAADGSLQSGKEKWCVTCHDETETASVISDVTAPNIAGDEDDTSYTYGAISGTGWGFYKTGHGLPASSAYPESGGAVSGAGKECLDCHDSTVDHIDGNARTFDDDNSTSDQSSEYRAGYRLQLVGGQEPMQMPMTSDSINNTYFRLCMQTGCHPDDGTGPYLNSSNLNTNFRIGESPGDNYHNYHLDFNNQEYSPDWDFGGNVSQPTCVTCHNVHGSKRLVMLRDGTLTGVAPGFEIWYFNPDITDTEYPPNPEDLPLTASTGTRYLRTTPQRFCDAACHNGPLVTVTRTPWSEGSIPQDPTLDWTGEANYTADGVNPDSGASGDSFMFRVEYTDKNNDAPTSIQVWVDVDDSGTYEAGEMYDMTPANPADSNYTDGRVYKKTLTLSRVSDDTLIYRFYAYDGAAAATGSPTTDSTVIIPNSAPVMYWTGEPYYISDGVNPDTGGTATGFEFRVKYMDVDGDAPGLIQVGIDMNNDDDYDDPGERQTMSPVAGGDGDYTNGELYAYEWIIGSAGTFDYRFFASDGSLDATGGPTSDNSVTVQSTANNVPVLEWTIAACLTDGVKPAEGLSTGDFEFMVKYTDADNECPVSDTSDIQVWVDVDDSTVYEADEKINLTETDASDTDCTDGKIYRVTMPIVYAGDGVYNYRFSASDGIALDNAIGDPVTGGGTVTVLDTTGRKGVRAGSGDSDPWYNSIQSAMDSVTDDVTILVYEGTYNERPYFWSDDDNTYLKSVCGPDNTIITYSTGDTVYFLSNSGSTIDGFSITGSTANDGIALNTGDPLIKNCRIYGNARGIDTGHSGSTLHLEDSEVYENTSRGIYVNAGSGHTISNSIIRDNTENVDFGGAGVYSNSGGITFTDSTIRDNTATGAGGGITANSAAMEFYRCTISGNVASDRSGAIDLANLGAAIYAENSVFADNQGTDGGVSYINGGTFTAVNSTFANNVATDQGGAFFSNSGTIEIGDSILWNNYAATSGHIVYFNWGTMILNDSILNNDGDGVYYDAPYFDGTSTPEVSGYTSQDDPLFVDESGGDYHIQSTSNAVDNASGAYYHILTYNIQSDTGTTVATGVTTDAPASCAAATAAVTTLMSGSNHNCTSQNTAISAAGTLLEAYFNTAYTSSTPVTGRTFKIRLVDADTGGWQAGVQLFHVDPAGTKTDFSGSEVTQNVSSGGDSFYTLNLSGQSATVPSGSKLGVRVRAISGTSTSMAAYWGSDADSSPGSLPTNSSGVLKIVEQRDAPTDDIDSESRPQGSDNDIGADEYTSASDNSGPVLTWTGETNYASDGVNPNSGTGESIFEFRVTYTDEDDDAPASMQVWIDEDDSESYESGEKYDMTGAGYDAVYSDGRIYTKTLTLSFVGDGNINYRFYASDGTVDAAGAPASGSTVTVTNNAPSLSWTGETNYASDGVDPDSSPSGTDYIFRVDYTDIDNTAPAYVEVWVDEDDSEEAGDSKYSLSEKYSMTATDGGDSDYTDGKRYTKTLNLTRYGDGDLNYTFRAYDGVDLATGDPASDSTVTVTVPTVTFTSASQVTPDETAADYTITAQLSGTSDVDVTVPYTVNASSTADNPDDYTIAPTGPDEIVISAGTLSADITISVASDTDVEGNETVIVDMGAPTNAVQGAVTTHILNITDDDSLSVTFTADSQTTAGETGTATITAQLSQTSGADVTVPFTVNGSSTAVDPDDYSITASPIVITAGNLSADITVTIATDSLDENNETLVVDMGTPTGAEQGGITTHTVTITDDDPTPTVTFTSASQSVEEDNTTATITAQLSAVSSFDVTVPFSVNGSSTAADPDDYTIDSSPLIITAGNLSADITVTIVEDGDNEPDETVIVDMGTPTNATQGATTTHTLTITNDDGSGTTWTVCKTTHADHPCNFQSINGGIDDTGVLDGDTLLVSDDTYSETVDFDGKNITIRSSDGAATTIIQGQFTYTNDAVVSFENSETSSAVLDGFTINNQASANGNTRGIYIAGGSSPTIQNCIVEDNAQGYGSGGGAMYITGTDSGATIISSTIQNNTAQANTGGGGIYMAGTGTVTITDSTLQSNISTSTNGASSAGAIRIVSGTVNISGSHILSNSSAIAAGGIHLMGGSMTMSKSYVMGNRTYGPSNWSDGGGIKIDSGATATIINSVIAGNTADSAWQADGGGIYNAGTLNLYFSTVADNFAEQYGGGIYPGGTENIYNSIIWGNSCNHPGAYNVNIHSSGNLDNDVSNEYSSDPSFTGRSAATSDNPTTDGDYSLQSGSICIDAGSSSNAPSDDIDSQPRPIGSGYDIGADEYVASSATHTVTKTADTNDGTCDADCSLREAVGAANADGADSLIIIPAGTYTLTRTGTGEDSNSTGDLDINTGDVAISGAGSGSTIIDGGDIDRVFHQPWWQGITITVKDVKITNGDAGANAGGCLFVTNSPLYITDSVIDSCGNSVDATDGGAVHLNGGSLTVSGSTFSNNNTSTMGGAVMIYNESATITDSTFTGNTAVSGGGAVRGSNGTVTVTGSTFTGNTLGATSQGGAINVSSGSVSITDSTFSGNSAQHGGGVTADTNITLNRSTFTGNTATGVGGAIVSWDSTNIYIYNSTISGNNAGGGGGFYTMGNCTIKSSTIANNSASWSGGIHIDEAGDTCSVQNTIFYNNGTTCGGSGSITSLGYNIDDNSSCGFTQTGDQQGTDALLNALADNGGPTQTHALQTSPGLSPAIDTGDNTACAASPVNNMDQRGETRPADGDGDLTPTCDIGAYEYIP